MSYRQYATQWSQWSTTVRVVVRDAAALADARAAVAGVLAAVGAAIDRFDPDSEVSILARNRAVDVPISPLLAATVAQALRVARLTDGAVDPTLGWAMVELGYDRAFTGQPPQGTRSGLRVLTTARWSDVQLHGDRLTLPDGVLLDLGAVGKAHAVDLAAEAAHAALAAPVLVAIGGDLRACGTPGAEPWLVEVAERPADPPAAWVQVGDGGVATSTTTTRTWSTSERRMHHVLDPRTLRPAAIHWRTCTVAARTCVDANAAATASLVKGRAATEWLRRLGLPARLVHRDGSVRAVGGWPTRSAA